jgi:hypothetical protein
MSITAAGQKGYAPVMTPQHDIPLHSEPSNEGGDLHVDAFGLTAEDHAAMDRRDAARALYGMDFEREFADLEAGRHPLQQPRG